MGKEQEFLTQLKWYAYWQLNQGYALQVKPPKTYAYGKENKNGKP